MGPKLKLESELRLKYWSLWPLIGAECATPKIGHFGALSILNFVVVVQLLSLVRLFVTPRTGSPPGSSVHGILQARIPEPFPSPRDLPDSEIEPTSPTLQILYSEPPFAQIHVRGVSDTI